jgi:hypothetical protein
MAPRGKKLETITLVIAILGLAIAFTGVNYQGVTTFISSLLFPKSDYIIISYLEPKYDLSFLTNLKISPYYYIVPNILLKSNTPYIGNPLQFSVSFENRGKVNVDKPRIEVRITDYLYRTWGQLSINTTKESVQKQINIEYQFPTQDQKILGAWSIYLTLYDNSNNQLISYEAVSFMTTDSPPTNPYVIILIGIISFPAGFVFSRYGIPWIEKRIQKGKKQFISNLPT